MNIMELIRMKGKHYDWVDCSYCSSITDNRNNKRLTERINYGYYKTNDCTTYGKRIK